MSCNNLPFEASYGFVSPSSFASWGFLMNTLIDVHHHAIPDFYAAAMRKEGMEEIDGFPIPEWS
jgi:hypothetical protein